MRENKNAVCGKRQSAAKIDVRRVPDHLGTGQHLRLAAALFLLEMLAHEFPPEASGEAVSKNVYTESTLLHAAQRLGFRVKTIALKTKYCAALPPPLLVNIGPPFGHKTLLIT